MISLLLKIGPWFAALCGIVTAFFMRQQVKTAKAEADKALAENKESAAQANADAALAGANSTKERIDVENTIAVQPAGTSAQRLRDEWSRD